LEQSAATGLVLDSVKGPPPHVNDVVVVDMVPLEGVAARDIGVRGRRRTKTRMEISGTRRGIHMGDLRCRRFLS